MKFQINSFGELTEVRNRNVMGEVRKSFPISSAYLIDFPIIKKSIRDMDFLKGKTLMLAPMAFTAGVGVMTGGSGVFWSAFMQYIFPWMLDIAKVFCAIKIAQAFYQERRGGRDEGTGFGALVTYGRWYLTFWLIPWGVELIDQIGGTMLNDLRKGMSN